MSEYFTSVGSVVFRCRPSVACYRPDIVINVIPSTHDAVSARIRVFLSLFIHVRNVNVTLAPFRVRRVRALISSDVLWKKSPKFCTAMKKIWHDVIGRVNCVLTAVEGGGVAVASEGKHAEKFGREADRRLLQRRLK